MKRSTVIGVDIGTQGTKAAVFLTDGRCIAEAFVPSRLLKDGPGIVREDPEEQVASVAGAIRECLDALDGRADEVAAIAFDGQMAGIVGIGRDGRNVTPYDSWLDTQCKAQIEQMNVEAGSEILLSTGTVPSFNHGPKILWWKQEHPDVYARISSFVQPAAYAAMRLCGMKAEESFIDHTYLHFSGFADNSAGTWNRSLLSRFGVSVEKLPRILSPSEIVGRIDRHAAAVSGLREGTPVAAGCGDTAASFLASGANEIGKCVDVAGTASVFAGTTGAYRIDEVSRSVACSRSVVPGLWHPYAYVNGGGMNLEWFRSIIGGVSSGSDSDAPSLEELDRGAARLPLRHDDPIFVPHLGGRVMPNDSSLRGGWIGLNWTHGREHLYRAMLESIALEYGSYLRVMRSVFPEVEFSELRATGGGSTSAFWNRMKATVCRMPVGTVAESKGSPAGAAMVAGVAVALFPDFSKVCDEWIRVEPAEIPDVSSAAYYSRRLASYEQVLSRITGFRLQ